MGGFRYPIAPPQPAVTNPFTVEFDYLPAPLIQTPDPATDPNLYTTLIRVSDAAAAAGADRIAHVFPRTNVRFVADQSAGFDATQLAQHYLDDNDSNPREIRGRWFALGIPTDIGPARQSAGWDLIPTVVVYHEVIVDREVIRESVVPLLERSEVKIKHVDDPSFEGELTSIQDKLQAWLEGKTKVSFPPDGPFPLPRVPTSGNTRMLRVSALLMDGRGVDRQTYHRIVSTLDDVTAGTALGNSMTLVHVPVSVLYSRIPAALLDPAHAAHPLASAWPVPPDEWRAIMFSFADRLRSNVTRLGSNKMFAELQATIDGGAALPLPGSGLLIYRSTATRDEVRVVRAADGAAQNLSLIRTLFGSSASIGPVASIGQGHIQRGVSRIYIGRLTLAANPGRYFGIPTELSRLQEFINHVTPHHSVTLTTAGVFTRTMGFLAQAVAHHVSNTLSIPPSASFGYFISTAWSLLVFEGSQKDEGKPIKWLIELELQHGEIDLSGIVQPIWMTNKADVVGDHGWKVFHQTDESQDGRKDHFLTNAAGRFIFSPPLAGNVIFNIAAGIVHGMYEDDPNDSEFNEAGEEFAEWGLMSSYDPTNDEWGLSVPYETYDPELVEQWLLDHIVETETL